MSFKKIVATLSLCVLSAVTSQQASAGLTYEVVDVADTTAGVNRLKTIYHLDGAFELFGSFNVLYDYTQYANLELTATLGADWFAMTLQQPDPVLGADGILTYLALNDIADASATFEVDFDFLAAGLPGAQSYELVGANLDSRALRTSPFGAVSRVPEPATVALILAGLALLVSRPQRRKRSTPPART